MGTLKRLFIVLVLLMAGVCFGADEENRSRLGFVKVISFYLQDGRAIEGKVISEESKIYVVEHVQGSVISADKFAKNDVDRKSVSGKNVLEVLYLESLAEYFASRVWDFRDDPDDFAQAIRLYEKAGELWAASKGNEHEKVGEIAEKVARLRKDKDAWVKEIEERARLKRLEFEATFDDRLAEVNEKVDLLTKHVGEDFDKVGGRLNEVARDAQDSYRKLEASFNDFGVDFIARLNEVIYNVEVNQREVERLWRNRYSPRYYYKPSSKVDEQP